MPPRLPRFTVMAEEGQDNSGTGVADPIVIPHDRIADASAYAEAATKLVNAGLAGDRSALDTSRLIDLLEDACKRWTGKTIEEAGRESLSSIERFMGLMESARPLLEQVLEAVHDVEDIRLTAEKKKLYCKMIHDVIELQEKALDDPAIFWLYVGRDSEADSETSTNRFGVFDMQPFHITMFDVWNTKADRQTLMLAPPGHAKSTNMRGNVAWRIGKQPKIRILLLALDVIKAGKEVLALMRIVQLPTYKAIFPNIIMLDRTDDVQKSSKGFTLASVDGDKADSNIHSREPTISGFGINSSINGDGYSMIICDDIVNPKAKDEAYCRNHTTAIFHNVVRQRLRDASVAELHIVATPWHPDDLYGRIKRDQREGRSTRWKIVEFPILDLEEHKRGDHYACLFRLNPIHASGRLVKKMFFYPSTENEWTNDREKAKVKAIASGERWLSIDPAASDNKGSADNGVIDASFTHEGFLFVTDVHALRMSPVSFLDWIAELIFNSESEAPVYGLQIEGQASNRQGADLFIRSLQQILADRHFKGEVNMIVTDCHVGGVSQNRGKSARLKAASMPIETARVRFAGEKRRKPTGDGFWYTVIPDTTMEKLKGAVLDFKTSVDADIVDALSQLVLQNFERLKSAMPDAVKEENTLPMDPMSRMNRAQMDAMDQKMDDEAAGIHEWEDETLVFSCK